jgi:hypothetical protein
MAKPAAKSKRPAKPRPLQGTQIDGRGISVVRHGTAVHIVIATSSPEAALRTAQMVAAQLEQGQLVLTIEPFEAPPARTN